MDEVEQGTFWTHALCGRTYDDASAEEVARWNELVARTGFCCEYCREDNGEPPKGQRNDSAR